VREYLLVFVVAAAMTYVATPFVRWVAVATGAFTPVRDRDVHAVPIPRLGGVGILLGFAASMLVASRLPYLSQVFPTGELKGVLVAAVIVCGIGALDDIRELDWITKLAGQVLAAGIMAFKGVQLLSLPLFDGLAAGIVGIAALAFFAYSYLLSRSYDPPNVFTSATFITAALVGCCAGFLPHNFHPARLFMGDSGALLLGLLLAAATISMTGNVDPSDVSRDALISTFLPIVLPLAILSLPLLDVLLAGVRRTRAGQRPWHPDAKHLHHRMLQIGHGHRRAVLLLWLWAAVAALGSVSFIFLDPWVALGSVVGMVAVAGFLTLSLPRWAPPGQRVS
jgi:UDP-GlcNAc:undecaprenyl-phosphate GlcNAc-1-phosphate transferase